ncbi:unnamed protein product [Rotaria socialis]
MFNDSITVNIPLKSDDDTEVNINNDPPAYQNPHLDFNEGRKDFSIAIVFGIHIIVVIVVGIVLGLPIVLQHMKQISLAKRLRLSADFGIKHFVYSLSGAAVVACTVGDWWFSNDDCRLYGMSNSIKRAFTTNLGTICFGSLFHLFISSIFTTLLASCVRTVFVCFALHPAALGATHPEHLEKLTTVWHKFYPEEFASTL